MRLLRNNHKHICRCNAVYNSIGNIVLYRDVWFLLIVFGILQIIIILFIDDLKIEHVITSVASHIAIAVKWHMAFELVLTKELTKEEFSVFN